ncbi:MAG: DUF1015 domain-containing protein [Bacteroidetes bacterium]|nr:DUF1015 domain-containing protein [Bacteroidota bacterium]
MAIIRPFRALRPAPALAAEVATLPYDVMNTAEARQMAAGHPHSFLHVSRAEIDLPEGINDHSQEVYDQAARAFQGFIKDGTLVQDAGDYLYIYAQTMAGRRQVGLVACSSIEDYFHDVIRKHEYTRPEKEQDRIDHMKAVRAHVGPIFLTYPAHTGVKQIISRTIAGSPVNDFTSEDGIRHQVWVINGAADIGAITGYFSSDIPYTYIADGHHRTASAAKVGKQLRDANPAHTGQEEYNYFLSVLFPADELAIMDYNRVIRDLNGMTKEELLSKLADKFEISQVDATQAKPTALHDFAMYIDHQWYRLTAKPGTWTTDPIGILDVSILSNNVLDPLFGIKDQRTDKRIDFVGGIRGLAQLERRVDTGEMAVAFALYPVSLQQLMDIADSGSVMPPKSTWFEPKLRDGLFSHLF